MSKELEALEKLTNYKCSCMREKTECKKIIEDALKKYEMEHTLIIRLENINYELVREKQENEKKIKAFEIIKNKRVNVEWLLETENVEEYNESLYDNLTQEEYDLLKEELK